MLEGLAHSTIQWIDDFMLGAMYDTRELIIAWNCGAVSGIAFSPKRKLPFHQFWDSPSPVALLLHECSQPGSTDSVKLFFVNHV
jgi:hypothetical protein